MAAGGAVVDIGSFVALGDSFTEGLDDRLSDQQGYRGWADRLAEMLAERRPGLRYANLAVRGKRLAEVATEQLPQAIAMAPDLVSLAAGGNDLLRPGGDPGHPRRHLPGGGPHAAGGWLPGAHVHRVRPAVPGAPAHPRQGGRVQHASAGDRRPAPVLPGGPVVDERAGRPARLECRPAAPDPGRASPGGAAGVRGARRAGHRGLAGTVACRRAGYVAAGRAAWLAARQMDLRWAWAHAAPWAVRRLRGVSSGDGIPPKRPELLPL